MEIKTIFGILLLAILLALVVWGIISQGIQGGFNLSIGFFGDWLNKLFSPST
jgi:hypothetical protein